MIGKFLEEEENKQPENGIKSEAHQTETFVQADVLNLPETNEPDNILELPEIEVFSESQKVIPEKAPPAYTPFSFETEKPKQSFIPDSPAEIIRKSGLAWSAAIVLFGSVVFLMVLGWLFDLIFGSQPWGIVLGIFIGGAIGFFQFFRITSQILKDPQTGNRSTSILENEPRKKDEPPSFNP
ncbi:MAG TPA: AtpZ/AtpI family protein [Pyrinomonadaceae bacterium]|nr:AtpZ/AtpI family protein [Pyrinomonadaceae bacterium]